MRNLNLGDGQGRFLTLCLLGEVSWNQHTFRLRTLELHG